jgi:dTDP-glucose 4,6-dehydratase
VQKHAITHVLHLAAESHVDRSIVNPGDFIHTNVLGTYHLLEACRQVWSADQCRFVHVSTDEVYGSLPTTGRFTESSPYAPSSPYSASKAASDLLVRAYFKTYAFPSIVTNCSNNFGPYQFPEKLIPVTIKNALADTAIPIYGDGLNVRDWLYVRDHVDALWKILLHGRSGEAYNIGGGNELTNLQLVEQVCDIVDGLRGSTIGASRRLISFVSDRLGHDRRYAVDSRKMECELKWKPRQPLQDCLRETVRWYLVHQDWVKTVLSRLETAPK